MSTPNESPGRSQLKCALAQTLVMVDSQNCPDLDMLTDYVQGVVGDEMHTKIYAHIVECSLCATLVAELNQTFHGLLVLHNGLAGWLGPVVEFAHLPPLRGNLAHQWRDHNIHCTRCRHRIRKLQVTLSPPVMALIGAGVAILVSNYTDFPKKGNRGNNTIPGIQRGPRATLALERYLYPTEDLDEVQQHWQQIAVAHPDNLAAHEALARIYSKRVEQTNDSRRKAEWQEQAQLERAKLRELLGK